MKQKSTMNFIRVRTFHKQPQITKPIRNFKRWKWMLRKFIESLLSGSRRITVHARIGKDRNSSLDGGVYRGSPEGKLNSTHCASRGNHPNFEYLLSSIYYVGNLDHCIFHISNTIFCEQIFFSFLIGLGTYGIRNPSPARVPNMQLNYKFLGFSC